MNITTTFTTRRLALGAAYVVAAIAGTESYSHIVAVTAAHGQSTTMSHLYPFSVDGVVLVGTLALAARRRNFMAWLAVVAGVVATLAANIAAAEPTLLGRCISAWPAVAFLIATEIVLKGASKTAEAAAEAADAAAAAPTAEELAAAIAAEAAAAAAAERSARSARAAATRAANKAEAARAAEARREARKARADERAARTPVQQIEALVDDAPVSPAPQPAPVAWDKVAQMLDQAQTA